MVKLPSPKHCRRCGKRGKVTDSRYSRYGWQRRTHHCRGCGIFWPSWETVINPRNLMPAIRPPRVKKRRSRPRP